MYSNPGKGAKYLLDEALGRTNDEKPYVYLSDGGHFENLGLYEMVLRRCHTILVIDADEDRDFAFENLGNAIRKIRTDLGISIDFESFSNFPKRNKGVARRSNPLLRCRKDSLRPRIMPATDGRLIFIKPTITGKESADVLNYEQQPSRVSRTRLRRISGSPSRNSRVIARWVSTRSSKSSRNRRPAIAGPTCTPRRGKFCQNFN